MNADTQINVFDTDDQLFATLARVFGKKESKGSEWVTFRAGDVSLTFFGPLKTAAAESVPDFIPAVTA